MTRLLQPVLTLLCVGITLHGFAQTDTTVRPSPDSIVVKDAVDLSCNMGVNTVAMKDTLSFYDVDPALINDLYYMTGNSAGAAITLKFNNGGAAVAPGVYPAAPINSSYGPGYVSVRLYWWAEDTEWMADSGSKIMFP